MMSRSPAIDFSAFWAEVQDSITWLQVFFAKHSSHCQSELEKAIQYIVFFRQINEIAKITSKSDSRKIGIRLRICNRSLSIFLWQRIKGIPRNQISITILFETTIAFWILEALEAASLTFHRAQIWAHFVRIRTSGAQTIKMPTLLQVMASFYLYEVVLSAALVKNRRFYCNSLLSGKKLLKFSTYYPNDVQCCQPTLKKSTPKERPTYLMWQVEAWYIDCKFLLQVGWKYWPSIANGDFGSGWRFSFFRNNYDST